MALNILELIAGTSVDLKGLEDGLAKAEAIAADYGKSVARNMSEPPAQAMKDLSKLSREELEKMAVATERQAAATKQAYSAHQANAVQAKDALEQQLKVVNELIARQTTYAASLKAGTAQQIEATAALTEMKTQAASLNKEISGIGSTAMLAFGAITAAVGATIGALTLAVKKTADYGLEMEHMSNRMGMTVEQTATLVGIMERFGVNANMGARAMQMLSTQVKQTQESLDPFATRLGKTLGSLRDTSGQALNMGQVLDLIRQKVSSATSDSERLEIATSLLGARIGGQLVPMLKLSNEEWEKQRAAVQGSLGPVEKAAEQALAYKQATAGLEQAFRGLQVEIGTALLPAIISLTTNFTLLFNFIKNNATAIGDFFRDALGPLAELNSGMKTLTYSFLWWGEKTGQLAEGTAENFMQMGERMEKALAETGKAAEQADEDMSKLGQEINLTEQNMRKVVDQARQHLTLLEKAHALGMQEGSEAAERVQLEQALTRLTEQRVQLEKELQQGATPAQRERIEKDLLKNRVEAAQMAADLTLKGYKDEELALKAMGAWNLSNETALLERKLADENIVGDERKKIEAELYQKRKQLAEEAVKAARSLGLMSIDEEIKYRRQRMAELAGKGDITGAAQELTKIRDLATKQADEVMEFIKKLRVVSLQDEIDYQRKRLDLFKGNAEEEMKILSKIADLDKQLYDKRLQFSLNYVQGAISAYRDLTKAIGESADAIAGPKEEQTFQRAAVDAERARIQQARELEYIAAHGGTEETRNLAVKQSQEIMKQYEEMLQLGKEIPASFRDALTAARHVLEAAGLGEEVRVPGEPSPTMRELAPQEKIEQLQKDASEGMKSAADEMTSSAGTMKDASREMKSAAEEIGDAASAFGKEERAEPAGVKDISEEIRKSISSLERREEPEGTRDVISSLQGLGAEVSSGVEGAMRDTASSIRGLRQPTPTREEPEGADWQQAFLNRMQQIERESSSQMKDAIRESLAPLKGIQKPDGEAGGMRDALSAARDLIRAASTGEEVRAPGGPSPLVGSLLGPTEGLATSGLARGTDIPRLDTSFTDIAIRIRDVLLGTIPNIQNFSNQLAAANRQMAALTNLQNNPGIVGPGGSYTLGGTYLGSPAPAVASSTPAPTQGPGAQAPASPSPTVGIGTTAAQTNQKLDNLTQAVKDLPAAIVAGNQSQQASNAESLAAALSQVLQQRTSGVNVNVSLDPGTGDLFINRIVQEIS